MILFNNQYTRESVKVTLFTLEKLQMVAIKSACNYLKFQLN